MQGGNTPLGFSTAGLPERERLTMFREVFGRALVNMDIVPLDDMPQADAVLRTLPGLNILRSSNSPHRFQTMHDPGRGSDYFNSVFRRTFGETPSDVRNRARHDTEQP